MRKTTISIENCIRLLNETTRTSFLTLQITLEKKDITNKPYFLKVSADSHNFLEQSFLIDEQCITFFGSHEDPIVQDEKHLFLSVHIKAELLKAKYQNVTVQITQENFLFEEIFCNLPYDNLFETLNSKIFNNTVSSTQDCFLTLHLGDNKAHYHEEQFLLKKGEIFDFSYYIPLYSYIGVQCSYENISPEIEEKFILKGQKGIFETALYKKNGITYHSQLPFSSKYLNHYNDKNISTEFNLATTIDDIINYHKKHTIRYFEMDYEFLKEHYKTHLTYSQSNLYSDKKLKGVIHTELDVCLECPHKSTCLQVVPSGLSYDLFKENINKTAPDSCRIFKLITN